MFIIFSKLIGNERISRLACKLCWPFCPCGRTAVNISLTFRALPVSFASRSVSVEGRTAVNVSLSFRTAMFTRMSWWFSTMTSSSCPAMLPSPWSATSAGPGTSPSARTWRPVGQYILRERESRKILEGSHDDV
jgi:hypothetical protein